MIDLRFREGENGIMYQPACYQCRKDASKHAAGVKEDSLCVPHLKAKLYEIVDAAKEVLRISDREHDAWDRLKSAIGYTKEK